jgi:hypothetical protein
VVQINQQTLLPGFDAESPRISRNSTTFVDNMRLPVHRWFRFSAGFSATWAESVITESFAKGPCRVFDPFAGSGTTLLAAENAGVQGLGVEAQPFLYRVAHAKLLRRTDPSEYVNLVRRIRIHADSRTASLDHYPELVRKCYTPDALKKLDVLRQALEGVKNKSPTWELAWLTLAATLRPSSYVGTAQWQYILPNKRKKRAADPFEAFESISRTVARDLRWSRETIKGPAAHVFQDDARSCSEVPPEFATLVITSPPYPNNFDYADATRLEMCFFGEINGWSDLQTKVRSRLVRSCSQHVPEKAVDLDSVLNGQELETITNELADVCSRLAKIRLTKGGKKTYHLMVACYFSDLARVWRALRRVCASPSQACFVIGDSAPYGVYVPVMDWMGRIALSAGFESYEFQKTRDRNVKWKNRKHRVPLCEGRLWVCG